MKSKIAQKAESILKNIKKGIYPNNLKGEIVGINSDKICSELDDVKSKVNEFISTFEEEIKKVKDAIDKPHAIKEAIRSVKKGRGELKNAKKEFLRLIEDTL